MRLVFASNNSHKLEEVRAILRAYVEVLSLKEIGFQEDIEETGETLEENSLLKAQAVWHYVQSLPERKADGVFADDTGLEISALGGKPGVHTARWAADEGADTANGDTSFNNRRLALRSLEGAEDRRARFRTVVTLIDAEGLMQQTEGVVNGMIAEEERGAGGFGYDPVFIPEGYTQTFAELPAEIKNGISHRARAVEGLRRLLFED